MFDGCDQSASDFHPCEPLEVSWDDAPRGVGCVGPKEHLFRRLVVLCPLASIAPIFIRDFPMLVGVGFASFEPYKLFFFRDVEVDFDEDRAVVRQLFLEAVDLFEGPFPLLLFGKTFHPFHKNASVPRAVKDGDVPVGRESGPETPEVVVLILFLGGFADRVDAIEARVESFNRALDGSAFSCGVGPFKHRDQGALCFGEGSLVAQEFELRVFQGRLVVLFIHTGMIEGVEAVGTIPRGAEEVRGHRASVMRKQPVCPESSLPSSKRRDALSLEGCVGVHCAGNASSFTGYLRFAFHSPT